MSESPSTVLITGISGFIAGNLAATLTQSGVPVVGIGRTPPPSFREDICQFLACDIRDFSAVSQIIGDVRPHTIYHLASQSILTTGGDEGARGTLETNVAGTWNLLEAARRAETPVVVVASSDKQYGATTEPPYDDLDSTGFRNGGLYELSKAQQDQTARLYAGMYDMPAIRIARLVNIYGPGDNNVSRIIPGTILRALAGQHPRLTAGPAGSSLRQYLFIDDAITALLAMATDAETHGNEPHRTAAGKLAQVGFNIAPGTPAAGSRHSFTAAEVIAAVRATLEEEFGISSPEPETLPGPPGVFEPGHQFNRGERIQTLLPDWTPRSLREGLRRTIPWYLDNRKLLPVP